MYMKRKIVPIAAISLLLGILFNVLFYGKIPGISVFIYSAAILAATFYLALKFRFNLNTSVYGLALAVLFFSFMVFVRANDFLIVVNILLVLYLLLTVVQVAYQPGKKLSQYRVLEYFNYIGELPLRFLQEFFQVSRRILSNRPTTDKSSYAPVLRGIILSLPFLVVFLLLLSSADLVFKKYVGSLFDFRLPGENLFEWGLVLFIASLFVGAYALIFMRTSQSANNEPTDDKKFDLGVTEAQIILGSVGLLFFIFVVVQLAYLFGGSDQITSTGYTYAEYARKGFFELIAVAVISFLLIWAVKTSTKARNATQNLALKCLSGALIVEVVIIMYSGHLRLNLYEEAYGFTTLRLLSHLFIGWLVVAFGLLASYIIREEQESRFAFRVFISVLGFFAVINLINPDAFIARRNIARFNETGKLDLYYLSSLSEDAVPTTAKLLDHPNEKLRKNVANMLSRQRGGTENQLKNWQSANLGAHRANRIFEDKAEEFVGADDYDYSEFKGD